jgi:hypothetical protein
MWAFPHRCSVANNKNGARSVGQEQIDFGEGFWSLKREDHRLRVFENGGEDNICN